MENKKKLIEVALPLDKINEASAREKSIRHGHPSTLHLWWARRPLASARAVIWASLVDDPSAHPELFPTEEDQQRERERLFKILEDLVIWENSNNPTVLERAKVEIRKSMGDDIPELLDPFAGGGAIPLEAERLGLKAHAHDLNPVAVMINKAMIEIPPKFQGKTAVNPEFRRHEGVTPCERSTGLARDVQYYGNWMKEEAQKRIGHLYPNVKLEDGEEVVPIAWIWARTVKCPNPACGCDVPLVSSFTLSTKKGNQAWLNPRWNNGEWSFEVEYGKCPDDKKTNKLGRGALFKCLKCGSTVDKRYIHDQFKDHKVTETLLGIVAEGKKGRLYLPASTEQIEISKIKKPEDIPLQAMNPECKDLVSGRGYGISSWDELFTNRQLTALTTFSDLVKEAQQKAENDAISGGFPDDGIGLVAGGSGAKAYGEAIAVYLSFAIDKLTDYHSSLCSWNSARDVIRNVFGRQAIPMVWDYAEANPFCSSSGSFKNMLDWIVKTIDDFPVENKGEAIQFDAASDCKLRNIMISTDPPYYDNIGYADLSDFFYVWMRRNLRDVYPNLFKTMLVPKSEELIASPYRYDGSKDKAKLFFEGGMKKTCEQLYKYSRDDVPVTIYYAYKQSDTDDKGTASSGWETMLNAVIDSGFSITGTWPMRTEKPGRTISNGTNALASSIVLVCRKRPESARVITRKKFLMELRKELYPALENLQKSNIAPVDLAQSSIGPGIAVFSKYKAVLESDGQEMTVRTALQLINKEIDAYFNEQGENYDQLTRFCIELYMQYGFNDMKFGEADTLARAKNTSVEKIVVAGDVDAQKGIVHLIDRKDLTDEVDYGNNLWRFAQQLTRAMEMDGIEGAADIYNKGSDEQKNKVKDLVYRLFTIADRKGWNSEAYAYNTLIQSWSDILDQAEKLKNRSEEIQLF